MRMMLPTDPGAEERGVIGPHWRQSSPWLCSQACLQRSSTSCAAFALVEHTHCYLLNKIVSVAATQPTLSYQRQLGAKEQAEPNLLLHKSAAIAGDPDGGVYTTDGQARLAIVSNGPSTHARMAAGVWTLRIVCRG